MPLVFDHFCEIGHRLFTIVFQCVEPFQRFDITDFSFGSPQLSYLFLSPCRESTSIGTRFGTSPVSSRTQTCRCVRISFGDGKTNVIWREVLQSRSDRLMTKISKTCSHSGSASWSAFQDLWGAHSGIVWEWRWMKLSRATVPMMCWDKTRG